MRISDWSSDVCSSDLLLTAILIAPCPREGGDTAIGTVIPEAHQISVQLLDRALLLARASHLPLQPGRQPFHERIQLARPLGHLELRLDRRSEEHTSELQSLMRISYAVFCLKKKKNT